MKPLSTLALIALLVAGSAWATPPRPVDLANREARWVAVQAVFAPPGATHGRMSAPARAWYAVGARPGERVVVVPGPEVERVFFADRRPVDGSFSDFVWVFDAASGHVLSAAFSGAVAEPIGIGFLRTTAEVSIALSASTRMRGGYRRPRRVAGRTVVAWCADPRRPDCTAVPTAAYDPESGWVRANAAVCATWRSLRTLAYTSLGRARFTELRADGGDAPPRLPEPLRTAAAAGAPSC